MIVGSEERQQRHSIPDRAERQPRPAPWPGLSVAADAIDVPLTPDQLARFAAYQRLLIEWNAKFNLTAIIDPTEIERRLFLDALRLVPVITRLAGDDASSLVDIGSGAGFPGIPLAITEPARPVTLIEATGKKVSFLTHVITELGLNQARAIHARAEEFARLPAERGRYDLATARAVSSLPALIELTMPLLQVGGHAVFPKGVDLAEELAAGQRAAAHLGARIVSDEIAPGSSTRVVIVTKERPTSVQFPRRAGIPAREPLGSAAEPARAAAAGAVRPNGHRRLPRLPDNDAARRRVAG